MAIRQYVLALGIIGAWGCVLTAPLAAQTAYTDTVKNKTLQPGDTITTSVDGSAPKAPLQQVQGHGLFIEGEKHKALGNNTITTNGDKAFGIFVNGSSPDSELENATDTIIVTHGKGSHGLYTWASANDVASTLTNVNITTRGGVDGSESHGIFSAGGAESNTLTVTGGSITVGSIVENAKGHGVYLIGTFNGSATFENVKIDTFGDGLKSAAIYTGDQVFLVGNGTVITTHGTNAPAFVADGGQLVVDSPGPPTLQTMADGSPGLVVINEGSVELQQPAGGLTVITAGKESPALYMGVVQFTENRVDLTNASLSTTGDNSPGIVFDHTKGASKNALDNAGGGNAITTKGMYSHGVLVKGTQGQDAVGFAANDKITTEGSNAHAVSVQEGAQLIIVPGTDDYGLLRLPTIGSNISVTGDDSALAHVSGTGSQLTIQGAGLPAGVVLGAKSWGVIAESSGTAIFAAGSTTQGYGLRASGGTLTFLGTATAENSKVQVDTGGMLDISGSSVANFMIASLSSDPQGDGGEVHLGNNTLDINGGTANTYGGIIKGTGGLKVDGGTNLTLSGINTYTGATAVNAGALRVDGSIAGTMAVASGGSLGGSGKVVGATTIATGGTLLGVEGQVLRFGNTLTLASGTNVNVALGVPETAGLFNVASNLTLDGTLNITNQGGFGPGLYRLFTYGGGLTNNGLDIGSVPAGVQASDLAVQTSVANQVNLVNNVGQVLTFWDGDTPANHDNGRVDGGTGTWNLTNSDWTDHDGVQNGQWTDDHYAIFQAQPGTVTVDGSGGAITVTGMQFAVDGYQIVGDPITLKDPQTTIRVGDGTPAGAAFTATIASDLIGTGGLLKTDLGKLVLTGTNTYTGGTTLKGGVLTVSSDTNLGGAVGGLTFDGGTLQVTGTNFTATPRKITWGGGGFDIADAANTFTVAQALNGGSLKVNAFGGQGTLKLTASDTFPGGTDVYGGALLVDGSNTLTSAVAVHAGATLGGNGAAVIVGDVANAGTLAPGFGLGTPGAKMTINGSYSASGNAKLNINTKLGDDSSPTDQLVITGAGHSATGTTGIVVSNAGGLGALTTGNGIPVVVTEDGATSTAGAFKLTDRVAAGAFDYLLKRGASGTADEQNSWYLTSSGGSGPPPDTGGPLIPPLGPPPNYRPEVSIYAAIPGTLRQQELTALGTFHDRSGDQRLAASAGERTGAWGRLFGQHMEQSHWSHTGSTFEGDTGGLQSGLDAMQWTSASGHQDRFGLFAAYARTTGNVRGYALGIVNAAAGRAELDGTSAGAYWTHLAPGGWYTDTVLMGTRFTGEGHAMGEEINISGYGVVASVEGGYPIPLWGGLKLEPQAQLVYQHINLDDVQDPYARVAYDTPDALFGRLGLRLSADLALLPFVLRPYLKANIWHDFTETDVISFNGVHDIWSRHKTTTLELGGGIVAQLSPSVGVWASAEYTTDIGDNPEEREGVRGTAGLRVVW